MHIYIYIYVCIHIYICIYLYVYIYVCIYMYIYMYVYIYIYIRISIYIHVYMYVYKYICIYKYFVIYTYTVYMDAWLSQVLSSQGICHKCLAGISWWMGLLDASIYSWICWRWFVFFWHGKSTTTMGTMYIKCKSFILLRRSGSATPSSLEESFIICFYLFR